MKPPKIQFVLTGILAFLAGSAAAETASYYRLEQQAAAAGMDAAQIKAPEPDNVVVEDVMVAFGLDDRALLRICGSLYTTAAKWGPNVTAHEFAHWLKLFQSADYQRLAVEQADVPWEKLTANEIYNDVVPALRKENRELAIQKWTKARQAKAEGSSPAKREPQAVKKSFEDNDSKPLPESRPRDEHERRFPR